MESRDELTLQASDPAAEAARASSRQPLGTAPFAGSRGGEVSAPPTGGGESEAPRVSEQGSTSTSAARPLDSEMPGGRPVIRAPEKLESELRKLLPLEWELSQAVVIDPQRQHVSIEVRAGDRVSHERARELAQQFYLRTGHQLEVVQLGATDKKPWPIAPGAEGRDKLSSPAAGEPQVPARPGEPSSAEETERSRPQGLQPESRKPSPAAVQAAIAPIEPYAANETADLQLDIETGPSPRSGRSGESSQSGQRAPGAGAAGTSGGAESADGQDGAAAGSQAQTRQRAEREAVGQRQRTGREQHEDQPGLGLVAQPEVEDREADPDEQKQRTSSCPQCGTRLGASPPGACPICRMGSPDVLMLVSVNYRRNGEKFVAAADAVSASDAARQALAAGDVGSVVSLRYMPQLPGQKEILRLQSGAPG